MANFKSNESEEVLPRLVEDLFDTEDTHELVATFVVKEREGSLSPDEVQRFRRHLSACAACSQSYSVLTGFLGTLKKLGRKIRPADESDSKVIAQRNSG
ncbi:MAG TPA: zf-HC2 domain-containing protein [Blastocatellia bacterium]|nr:zf-HC2 domain-containing protein [Blastocatellia bacterium]